MDFSNIIDLLAVGAAFAAVAFVVAAVVAWALAEAGVLGDG